MGQVAGRAASFGRTWPQLVHSYRVALGVGKIGGVEWRSTPIVPVHFPLSGQHASGGQGMDRAKENRTHR